MGSGGLQRDMQLVYRVHTHCLLRNSVQRCVGAGVGTARSWLVSLEAGASLVPCPSSSSTASFVSTSIRAPASLSTVTVLVQPCPSLPVHSSAPLFLAPPRRSQAANGAQDRRPMHGHEEGQGGDSSADTPDRGHGRMRLDGEPRVVRRALVQGLLREGPDQEAEAIFDDERRPDGRTGGRDARVPLVDIEEVNASRCTHLHSNH